MLHPLCGLPMRWLLLSGALVSWILLRSAPDPGTQGVVVMSFIVFLLAASIGTAAARDETVTRRFANALLIAGLLSSAIALCQSFAIEGYFYPLMAPSADHEAYANLRQRNQFASLAVMALLVLVWRGKAGALALLAAALLGLANAASASRTGLIGLAMVALLAWKWRAEHGTQRRCLLMAAVVAYLAGLIGLPGLQGDDAFGAVGRMGSDALACTSRRILWSNVTDLIADRPWLGWGWRELAWAHVMHDFPQRFCVLLDNAHNAPLHLAVELGLPVAAGVTGLVAWACWKVKPWTRQSPSRELAFGLVGMILLHSMVEYPLWYGPFQLVFGVALGLLLPASTMIDRARTALLGTCMLVVVLLAAWDYHRVWQIYLPVQERAAAFRDDTLRAISSSLFFQEQLDFARLTVTPLDESSARSQLELAQRMVHYSPEPRVLEILIDSAVLAGDTATADLYRLRFERVYPAEHAQWQARKP